MIELIERREGCKISEYPGAVEWLLENGLAHVSRGTKGYILSVVSGRTAETVGSLHANKELLAQHKRELMHRGILWLIQDKQTHWIGH